jgi:hypothetical protein
VLLSRFDDEIYKFGTATFVKFNVGTTHDLQASEDMSQL